MSTKEQAEKWVMDIFVEIYHKGDIEILSKQESPDFIVEFEGKKVGVELTDIFQDSNLDHSRLQQYSSDSSSFTDDLITLIQPNVGFTFSIGIHFNKNFPIKKSVRGQILNKTKDICVPAMINLSNHEHLELENYYDNLPNEIDDIHIYRFDGMEESINSKPEGGSVARLTLDHLKPILAKKEKKLSLYLHCDSQWLLIREGNYYAGSFSDVEIDTPIESLFDKVFLIRTRTRHLIELK